MIETLLFYLLVSLGINIVMFLIAFRMQSDKLTDISYAATFLTLALFGFFRSETSLFHGILLGMISLWGIRIGGFLLYRVLKTGTDKRFDGMRDKFVAFSRFWILQAITVWILMLPSLFAFEASGVLSPIGLSGIIIWLIGLSIESVADLQKYRFSQNPANKDRWIASGIWQYSRHPNYFGEILVWVGIYMFAFTSLSTTQQWAGLISPIFITILLLFVSGIPLLEKAADKKWGSSKEYQRYKSTTSVLIPLPRRS